MSPITFEIEIRATTRPGKVKAYVDVVCNIDDGSLKLFGFSICQVDGKPPFVGFPSKSGNVPGKFFPVVSAEGSLREALCKAVLDGYSAWSKQQ